MIREFKSGDVGKRVISAEGHRVGTVVKISGGAAHVKPVLDLSEIVRQKFGWTGEGPETYRLWKSAIKEITDGKIRLRATPAV